MKDLDRGLLQQLAVQICDLCGDMRKAEAALLGETLEVQQVHGPSARNLAHYLALRRHDLRDLQSQLSRLGLSSLGRTEGHVLSSFDKVYGLLGLLLNVRTPPLTTPLDVQIGDGSGLLEDNTEALLGSTPAKRKVRIMVTMSTEAAQDYGLVRDLLLNGMDCMRINCSHDGPEVWLGMIRNLEVAKAETGRSCRIAMDLAGPKLRTGAIEPGPAVVKCRPKRNVFGKVVAPMRLCLVGEDEVRPDKDSKSGGVVVPATRVFVAGLRAGDLVKLRDARGARRSLRVLEADGRSCVCQVDRTTYFTPGLRLKLDLSKKQASGVSRAQSGRVGSVPTLNQMLLLKAGEPLVVLRSSAIGRPEVRDSRGRVVSPGEIGVSLPGFLQHAKPGEPIWFDDGKIGGIIRGVDGEAVHVEITQARAEGERLGAEKGINLPQTRIDAPALTAADRETLKFVVHHADIVSYSFVRTESDVHALLEELKLLGGELLGVLLKIETRQAFENLPKLILTAMGARALGVMIARGDLAVECGYQRLAEIQEEILWICEAAHVPVVWATQVLEGLAKRGIPSRSEITDAAMGERAECVMLNKGPHAVKAVRVLDDILMRMQAHQEKKRSLLRRLNLADSFPIKV
jgi:pyruvate kinase